MVSGRGRAPYDANEPSEMAVAPRAGYYNCCTWLPGTLFCTYETFITDGDEFWIIIIMGNDVSLHR